MKEPTTPFSIDMMEKMQITREFLESEGWKLDNEYPLFETFTHTRNEDLKCSIGMYGSFSITELDWCNKTPGNTFSTVNRDLTKEDYHYIIKLLNIKQLSVISTTFK